MRKFIVPAALVAGMLLASAAGAATPPAGKTNSAPSTAASAANTKRAACEKEWRTRSPRPAHERAFVKACIAKG